MDGSIYQSALSLMWVGSQQSTSGRDWRCSGLPKLLIPIGYPVWSVTARVSSCLTGWCTWRSLRGVRIPAISLTCSTSALGLFTSHDDYGLRLYHTGGGLGFLAVNMVFPDARRGLVILTNTNAQQTYLKIADELSYLLVPPSENDLFARRIFTELQNGTARPLSPK